MHVCFHFLGQKETCCSDFYPHFVTLPNHIFIIVNKPLSKLATLLILKLFPNSSGFEEFSQTGPFQKLIKPRKCLLITLIYAKNISLNLSFPTFLQGTL